MTLIQLDNYINDKRYTFSAEDVLIIIADESCMIDDIEFALTPEIVGNEYPRLKLAAQKEVFRNTFSIVDNVHEQQ